MVRPDGLLEIGQIRRAHGVRGEVLVDLASDRSERVTTGARWFVRDGWLTVLAARPHQQRWLVTLEELNDRTAAQQYTNAPIYAVPIDDPDTMWVHELIGADVVDVSGRSRGKCVAVVANPAADLLELDSGVLVPVVFVVEHDAATIVLDPPTGLFDDEEGE
jgi:16S rRNA processing protein RimM